MQLFSVVFVILFTDGALAKNPECKYYVNPFCWLVRDAYTQNKDALHLLKSYRNGTTFDGDEERIETVIEKIRVVLNTETKSELLAPLSVALVTETHALFQLGVSCSGDKNGTTQCKEGLKHLCQATFDLVYAIGQVVEGSQKDRVLNAYNSVKAEARKYKESEICPMLYLDTGYAVSNALQR